MASPIIFSISNPKVNPDSNNSTKVNVLYLGESNQLDFTFATNIAGAKLAPTDSFTLFIPKVLLSTTDGLVLLGSDWKMQPITTNKSNTEYLFQFSPTHQIDFTSRVVISLQNLQASTITNSKVTVSAYWARRNYDIEGEQLFVQYPPDQADKNLLDKITIPDTPYINMDQQDVSSGLLYISPTYQVQTETRVLPLMNQIEVDIWYTSNSGHLVDDWNSSDKIQFLFSFLYGSTESDLTDTLQSGEQGYDPYTSAWNIDVQLGTVDSSLWQIQPLDPLNPVPVWVVKPLAENLYLFAPGQGLKLIFNNVASVLAAGNTSLYVQWSKIPGFNDGVYSMDILKGNPNPVKIIDLNVPNGMASCQPGTELQIEWGIFASPFMALTFEKEAQQSPDQLGADTVYTFETFNSKDTLGLIYTAENKTNSGVGRIIPDFSTVPQNYSCKLYVPGDPTINKVFNLNLDADTPPVIQQFTGTFGKDTEGYYIEFSWLVQSDNVNLYCTITDIADALPLSGANGAAATQKIRLADWDARKATYTLQVMGFSPTVSQSIETAVTFDGSMTLNDAGTGPVTSAQLQFSCTCGLQGALTFAITSFGLSVLQSDSQRSFTLSVNNDNTLLAQYELELSFQGEVLSQGPTFEIG
ncbi:MAG: hypothetical protein KDC44_15075, partial [Phaeodactylibacter sp.]|nr:hypothetical protein [Phaeodactylibacter sp.]